MKTATLPAQAPSTMTQCLVPLLYLASCLASLTIFWAIASNALTVPVLLVAGLVSWAGVLVAGRLEERVSADGTFFDG